MADLIIKQYDVDYSFIIKNYLDKKLWHKEWTLFVYKDYVFYLTLYSIDVKREEIEFQIYLRHKDYSNYTFIDYSINQSNINVLKKQINGAIYYLIYNYEETNIKKEQGYKMIKEAEYQEEETLTGIAEEFLDDNGVSNREIRDVYIDNYVSNNKKTDVYLNNYITGRRYQVLTDLYLIYTKASKDEERYNTVTNSIKSNYNYEEILKETNEYLKKLEEDDEELREELKECLETI